MPASAATFTLKPFDYAEARALAAALDLAEPVAVTLVRRGYTTVEAARAFLDADEHHDPFEFTAMAEVVERLRAAISAGRRITVHGDYDVDGVSSTAILIGALRELGAQCDWLIPDRLADGYGLTAEGVRGLVARGTELLVTADCGITSVGEVAAARAAGLEVIVTDHHQAGDELPDCPILHPVVSGYPCEELCATGVAHKLSAALRGERAAASDLDLVALATVADLVPLRGENRALVRRGLAVARRGHRPGLRALMGAASVQPERLDEGDIAFRLAPRINAAGRLYRADAGVELMLTGDSDRAAAIAAELDRANHERRATEREVLNGAERARAELPAGLGDAPALVLAGEGWHPGVVGIVASRLAERHLRPVVLIALDGEGRGRGSGRSVAGFDLLGGLRACERHLDRYGGHRAAAGLEIEAVRVGAFRETFLAHVSEALPGGHGARVESLDAVVDGEALGLEVARQFDRLAPFGKSNPEVRLLVPAARVGEVRAMGDGDRHARFTLTSGSRRARGVAFGVNGGLVAAGEAGPLDVSVRLELNEWNGAVEPRVVLGEVYEPVAAPNREALPEPDDEQWWRRLDGELEAPLRPWPPERALADARPREVVDRRGLSGVATLAALASGGAPVLAVCADAVRRRALVESAADPVRYGAGVAAIAAGRLCDVAAGRAVDGVLSAGEGIVLGDWARLERDPGLPRRFEHVVLVDPPPFAHAAAAAADRPREVAPGFLHLAWGRSEIELSLRLHDLQWPQRPGLAMLFRSLREAEATSATVADAVRSLVCGDGANRVSPEAAARSLRVLIELDLLAWDASAATRRLRVVSSEATNLERSPAFVAYRGRHEEGRRFLSEPRKRS